MDIEDVWSRIRAHAQELFHTKTGLPFTYEVPGQLPASGQGEPISVQDELCESARRHACARPG